LINLVEKKKAGGFPASPEDKILSRISELADRLFAKIESLDNCVKEVKGGEERLKQAGFYRHVVFSLMSEVRTVVDELEQFVAKKYWPFPSYGDMLFSI